MHYSLYVHGKIAVENGKFGKLLPIQNPMTVLWLDISKCPVKGSETWNVPAVNV